MSVEVVKLNDRVQIKTDQDYRISLADGHVGEVIKQFSFTGQNLPHL